MGWSRVDGVGEVGVEWTGWVRWGGVGEVGVEWTGWVRCGGVGEVGVEWTGWVGWLKVPLPTSLTSLLYLLLRSGMAGNTEAQHGIVVLLLPLGGVQGGGVHALTT